MATKKTAGKAKGSVKRRGAKKKRGAGKGGAGKGVSAHPNIKLLKAAALIDDRYLAAPVLRAIRNLTAPEVQALISVNSQVSLSVFFKVPIGPQRGR